MSLTFSASLSSRALSSVRPGNPLRPSDSLSISHCFVNRSRACTMARAGFAPGAVEGKIDCPVGACWGLGGCDEDVGSLPDAQSDDCAFVGDDGDVVGCYYG